ncbi:Tyrosine-protein phosphatase Lar [Amphibalanus amphitrite]|uniref:Tyrosine-protein phosphatase Lar n=1 Tax=Amphibalanus amphitrite TaxID=1232801 RepID=A0A6A4X0M0_AMPAM|nr:Tyrosine-protein phosphatase Lar [Amphibalanus amphitrite]
MGLDWVNGCHDPPVITEEPRDQKVPYSEAAAFFCRARGDPAPVITWWRNGEPLQPSLLVEFPQGKGFWVEPVRRTTDEGDYECVAENGVGDPVRAKASLTVIGGADSVRPSGFPRITQDPMPQPVEKGRDFVVRCRATGDPEPTIHWFKDGVPVNMSDSRYRLRGEPNRALVSVNDSLLEAADRGDISILTLIDLSRAFDVVDHQTLLNQLQLLQIDPGWFRSYLTGHKQCVQVPGGERSTLLPIDIGIFQGSCLGPMLYNIASIGAACYVPSEVNGSMVRMARYADDTQLVVSGPKERLPEIQTALEGVLDTLATYFLQNGMKINAAKTEMMVAGGRSALQAAERDPTTSAISCQPNKPQK